VTGHSDVHAPQGHSGDEDQTLDVAGQADQRFGTAEVGPTARPLLHVAATLERNVRGQHSGGCEWPPLAACGSVDPHHAQSQPPPLPIHPILDPIFTTRLPRNLYS
jgi:hypothetical protein